VLIADTRKHFSKRKNVTNKDIAHLVVTQQNVKEKATIYNENTIKHQLS